MTKTIEAGKQKRKQNRIQYEVLKKIALPVCAAGVFFLLIFNSSAAVDEARTALRTCAASIIPSLFPFFVVSSLIVSSGAADIIGKALGKIVSVLFGINGSTAAAIFTGIMSGAPTGAKMCAELYGKDLCDKRDAEKAMCICNGVSPAFCVAFVGQGIYRNSLTGWMFWIIHILSLFLVGVIFIRRKAPIPFSAEKQSESFQRLKLSGQIVSAVRSGVMSSIYVAGFIMISAVCNVLLRSYGVTGFIADGICAIFPETSYEGICGVLSGIIEFTTGVGQLGKVAISGGKINIPVAAMISFVLGFGGLSVYFQISAFANDAGLKMKGFLGFKFAVAVVASAVSTALFPLLSDLLCF